MKTGLAVPIRVGPTGRTVTSTDDEQAFKIIYLALGDDDNDNAFQQEVSLGKYEIFSTDDTAFRGRIMSRLFEIFRAFEAKKRFSLKRETIAWSRGAQGEVLLEFSYVNLETDEVSAFSRKFV